MTELLTAAQMRALEQAAIASGAVTGLELMERAGRGVVEAIFKEWPEFRITSHRAVVLCGPGNNGGDGFVVARLLKEWGWEVEVFLYGDPEKLPPDARVNYDRWLSMGEVCQDAQTASESRFKGPDLVVDAVFGTGLNRPLSPTAVEMLDAGFQMYPVVAIDCVSGQDMDSGRWLGAAEVKQPSAALTVTFHRMKLGHVLGESAASYDRIVVVDLGLKTINRGSVSVLQRPDGGFATISDVVKMTTKVGRPFAKDVSEHKYTHGHVLILSGPAGKSGAARLAARGRCG